MTPAQRVRRYLDSVAPAIPTTDNDRHKPRPPWTPAPEPLVPMLRDILAALEEKET